LYPLVIDGPVFPPEQAVSHPATPADVLSSDLAETMFELGFLKVDDFAVMALGAAVLAKHSASLVFRGPVMLTQGHDVRAEALRAQKFLSARSLRMAFSRSASARCLATADGRRLMVLNVIDEYSRLCLAIRVCSRCKAKDMVSVLEELTSLYQAPADIRSDNGPEFIPHALQDWCDASDTTSMAYIDSGSPWENGVAECCKARFRDEILNTELFTTTPEAWILTERWRWEYNPLRPHSAFQGHTLL
jgi:transposase InsO family protein